MFSKYDAPMMDEVDISANADCHCGCPSVDGGGSGGSTYKRKEVEDMLDAYYRELRKRLEEIKEKYPDYQHPDLEDSE